MSPPGPSEPGPGAYLAKGDGGAPDVTVLERKLQEEGLSPHRWGNGPGERYGWHCHDYHKVLYCLSGSIVFHTGEGDFELHPGDRLEVGSNVSHAATVGPDGVQCLEAAQGR